MKQLGLLVALAVALPAAAAAAPRGREAKETREMASTIVSEVTACKQVADNAARLACFDAATAKLAAATAAGDVKIIDREEVRATRRSLFGFELPKLPFFKGDDSANDTPSEIDTTIKSVGANEFGKWTITMDDGAVWRTTEPLPRDPRPGMPVHLKRGALGNYFMRVGSMRGVTAQRLR